MAVIPNPAPGYITSVKKKDEQGQVDWESPFLDLLNSYQADGIDYLYDLEPQSNNLFYAGFFRESDKQGGPQQRPFFNAAYRIKSISWNGPKLSFEHDVRTHLPKMKTHDYDVSVTIEWHEDVYHSVRRYHLNWMQRWYDRGYDVLRCGPEGKFRRMSVVAFHYVNAADPKQASVIEVPVAQPIMVFDFGGLVPEGFGDWTFSHEGDQNDTAVQITYKAARVNWSYGSNITIPDPAGGNKSIWLQSTTAVPAGVNQAKIWSPVGFAQDKAGTDASETDDLERLRIARNATSFIVDESSIG
jgi:hypothetical protein